MIFYVVKDRKTGMWEMGISYVIRYSRKCHFENAVKKL